MVVDGDGPEANGRLLEEFIRGISNANSLLVGTGSSALQFEGTPAVVVVVVVVVQQRKILR